LKNRSEWQKSLFLGFLSVSTQKQRRFSAALRRTGKALNFLY